MLRAAVVGVGNMGKHHARVYNDLEDVELVGVADKDQKKIENFSNHYKVPVYSSYEELFNKEKPDLVSVVVPTNLHHRVAIEAIKRGIHVLVEKPIALNRYEAEDLVSKANSKNITLGVGHVERFNPALIELKRRLQAGELGEIFLVHSRRQSPFPKYIKDVGVVMDLASHEVDILRYIIGKDPKSIYSRTIRRLHDIHEDALFSILSFENGISAMLDVNWLTPTKIRELRVTGQKGMFVVDYIAQDLYFYENSFRPDQWETLAIFRGIDEGNVTKIWVKKEEPLKLEILNFINSVYENKTPIVSGRDGLHALILSELILKSGDESRVINLSEEPIERIELS